MFRGFDLSPAREAVLKARIKQRVKETLPEGAFQVSIEEVACTEPGCPTRTTVISIVAEGQPTRRVLVHAPLSLVTIKEITHAIERGPAHHDAHPTP
jgi:hypothetical protein